MDKEKGKVLKPKLIRLGVLDENPHNPRKDYGNIEELAKTQREQGFDQAFTARPHPEEGGRFQVCKHSRSLRAALLNLEKGHFTMDTEVLVNVEDYSDEDMEYLPFMDNQVTKHHTMMEIAHYLKRRAELHKQRKLSVAPPTLDTKHYKGYDEVAAEIGRDPRWVAAVVGLTELPGAVQGMVSEEEHGRVGDGKMPWTTAIEIQRARLPEDEPVELAEKVVAGRWSKEQLLNAIARRRLVQSKKAHINLKDNLEADGFAEKPDSEEGVKAEVVKHIVENVEPEKQIEALTIAKQLSETYTPEVVKSRLEYETTPSIEVTNTEEVLLDKWYKGAKSFFSLWRANSLKYVAKKNHKLYIDYLRQMRDYIDEQLEAAGGIKKKVK